MPSQEDDIWEKGAIDHTAYVALFDYLTGRQGVAPYYLHKLLFMLRFSEFMAQVDVIVLKEARILSGRSIAHH